VAQNRWRHDGIDIFATHSDVNLGGDTFDNRVVDHIVKMFESRTGRLVKTNIEAIGKLRRECEKAKCILSSENETWIEIMDFTEGETLSERITRDLFERLNEDLFARTIEIVDKVVNESPISKVNITKVLLVGGSTRIPKIQALIQGFFDGRVELELWNPEMIVSGVAAVGGRLSGDPIAADNVILSGSWVTHGIKLRGGFMAFFIRPPKELPARVTRVFATVANNQHSAKIEVFQDCDMMTDGNIFLGEFTLDRLPPGRQGEVFIHVTLDLDENRVLRVIAGDRMSNHTEWITIRGPALWKDGDECPDVYYSTEGWFGLKRRRNEKGDITDSNRTELCKPNPPRSS
jgi:heat shock protein 5